MANGLYRGRGGRFRGVAMAAMLLFLAACGPASSQEVQGEPAAEALAIAPAAGNPAGNPVGNPVGNPIEQLSAYPADPQSGKRILTPTKTVLDSQAEVREAVVAAGEGTLLFTRGNACVVLEHAGQRYIREMQNETAQFASGQLQISEDNLRYLLSNPQTAYAQEQGDWNNIRTYPVAAVIDPGELVTDRWTGTGEKIAAPDEPVTKLFFKQGGTIPFIYSDNPESVRQEDGNLLTPEIPGYYTIREHIRAQQPYTAEYYQNKETGAIYTVGFAAINNGEAPATVTISKEAAAVDYIEGEKLSVEKLAKSVAMQLAYFHSDTPRTVSVAPGGVTILKAVDVPGNYGFSTAKIAFEADADLEVCIFYMYAGTAAEKIRDFPKTPILKTPHQLTGTFHQNILTASTYAPPGTRLRINSLHYVNENEYIMPDNATGKLPDAQAQNIVGNYGLTYELNLLGAGGKKLRIIPNFVSDTSSNEAALLICGEDGRWYSTGQLKKPDNPLEDRPAWVMNVPENGRLRFLIPGANSANWMVEVF